jgi:hypothetical protein
MSSLPNKPTTLDEYLAKRSGLWQRLLVFDEEMVLVRKLLFFHGIYSGMAKCTIRHVHKHGIPEFTASMPFTKKMTPQFTNNHSYFDINISCCRAMLGPPFLGRLFNKCRKILNDLNTVYKYRAWHIVT